MFWNMFLFRSLLSFTKGVSSIFLVVVRIHLVPEQPSIDRSQSSCFLICAVARSRLFSRHFRRSLVLLTVFPAMFPKCVLLSVSVSASPIIYIIHPSRLRVKQRLGQVQHGSFVVTSCMVRSHDDIEVVDLCHVDEFGHHQEGLERQLPTQGASAV